MDRDDSRFHSLLRRQIGKFFGSTERVPSQCMQFLALVDDAYRQFDEDRAMLERSIDLSSEELMQANADLGAVLEGFLDMYFRVDRDGVVLDYRAGAEMRRRLPADAMIGRRVQSFPLAHVGGKFDDGIAEVQATGALVTFNYEMLMDGAMASFEATLMPLHDEQVSVVIRDVTAARRARVREDALRARLARFERMESLGQMGRGVAHHLNNVLGPLVAYPDLLMAHMSEQSEAHRQLTAMKEAALRATAVLRDLGTLGRSDWQDAKSVDVSRVVAAYLDSPSFARLQARHPDIVVESQLDPLAGSSVGSAEHLRQAVKNLIAAAFEAIEGKGRISVQTDSLQLERARPGFDTIEEGAYALVRVSDSGRGIPASEREHIFEPFCTKRRTGKSGSGLGLAVVWGVVKDFHGYVDVTSQVGRGTEFALYLPSSPPVQASQPLPERDVRGTESILVVDDVAEQCFLAQRVLEPLGYRVTSAENGRSALKYLGSHAVDLVVIDMIMEEDFDGLDTWKAIRVIDPKQRAIIASGCAETQRVRQARNLGVSRCLRKPYTQRQLATAVRLALDA